MAGIAAAGVTITTAGGASDTTCPVCGSKNVEFHEVEFIENAVLQWATCSDCDSSWDNKYEFVGSTIFEEED